MAKGKGFEYRERDRESVKRRATQKGSSFDRYIKSEYPSFQAKEGNYQLRFMPPTWEDPDHYGYDVYVHYNVGADNQSYLCLQKMKGEPCPICEEAKKAEAAGDAEAAKALRPKKRVLVWLIDRDNEDDGPMIWGMPWTVDRDIAAMSENKRSKKILLLDHPEDGYDVMFSKEGSKKNVQYVGLQVDREPTPLCESEKQQDKWLEYIEENPLPECLHYYEYDYIKNVFAGKVKEDEDDSVARGEDDEEPEGKNVNRRMRRGQKDEEEEEKDEKPRGRRRLEPEDEEEQPRRRSRRDEEEEDEKPRGRRRAEPEDEESPLPDEDEKPRGRRRSSEKEDEEERPRRRREEPEEEPDEKPRGRRRSEPEEEEEPPRRRARREEPEEEPEEKPRRRRSRDD